MNEAHGALGMNRPVLAAVVAILLLFLGSLLLLDQFDAGQPGPPAPTRGSSEPTQVPLEPPIRVPPAPPISPEVSRQLAAPPTDPAPVPPQEALPPSGAPPAPAFVRERLDELRARITSRCGRLAFRLGDQLRRDRLGPDGHAVLLLEVEPQDEQLRVVGSTVQSFGSTRQSLVACAQLNLRGLVVPVTYLRRGERVKVQVVVGVE